MDSFWMWFIRPIAEAIGAVALFLVLFLILFAVVFLWSALSVWRDRNHDR